MLVFVYQVIGVFFRPSVCGGQGLDKCGKCYDSADDPARIPVGSDLACPSAFIDADGNPIDVGGGLSVGVVVAIILVAVSLVGLAVYFYMRQQQVRLLVVRCFVTFIMLCVCVCPERNAGRHRHNSCPIPADRRSKQSYHGQPRRSRWNWWVPPHWKY